ncbi:MAG: molecular chaperone TorD family protein [Desulfobacterota bacterium]|nr:molecular chaperone TorD family protein [Thermodesulfobacteriota bacterium]
MGKGNETLFRGVLLEDPQENGFERLRSEYFRLFENEGGVKISLVESCYKPWTRDPDCLLPFAREKGFLMGDSALHLSALYQYCGLEVPDLFKGMPDHLVLELEFLSFLYRHGREREARRFIEDHLDWIPSLVEMCQSVQAHPFYLSLVELLRLFLDSEKVRLEKEEHGEKEIDPTEL